MQDKQNEESGFKLLLIKSNNNGRKEERRIPPAFYFDVIFKRALAQHTMQPDNKQIVNIHLGPRLYCGTIRITAHV